MDVDHGHVDWKAMRNATPHVVQVVDSEKDMDNCQINNYAYDVGEYVSCCSYDA